MDFNATKKWIQSFLIKHMPTDCILCQLPLEKPQRFTQLCATCVLDMPTYPLGWDIKQHDPKATSELTCSNLAGITAIGKYDWPLDHVLLQLKFGRRLWAARPIGALLTKQLSQLIWPQIDFVCPLPLHKNRLRSRGFNQAFVICQHIKFDLPVNILCSLKRVKYSMPQSELSRRERLQNVRNIFRCSEDLTGKTILLVDDVVTTGATLDNAAKALLEQNATAVYAAVGAIRTLD
ncbi:ComF family protein [Psychrosphaera sp. B3R10]|nr:MULTISPECIES: ComF family protein [unclassified Psychrosphaera]MBU2883397.1 ComF family protein [Psychrosphaera sp. I2R16]MBU2990509.1 ComF family protein [Psychrosphaera sp. B3R10]